MTKKIFLPLLLAAPLVLASCGNSAPKEPGAFEKGENLLTAEVLKELIPEINEADHLAQVSITIQTVDAEANPVWSEVALPGADAAGFLVFEKSETDAETGFTTVTREAYNKFTLEKVLTWENSDDPEDLEIDDVAFEQASYQYESTTRYITGLGVATHSKTVFVMEELTPVVDHVDYVDMDNWGHKLLSYTNEHPEGYEFAVETEEGESVTMLNLVKWSKDHYETSIAMYYNGFTKLAGVPSEMLFPEGFFIGNEKSVSHDGVVYTFVDSADKYEVFKEGVEKAVCSLDKAVIRTSVAHAAFEENFFYVLQKEVPDDASDFTYLSHTPEGNQLKYKQEIHFVNYFTGEDKLIEAPYAVAGYNKIELDLETEFGYIGLASIREDKTVDPATMKSFIIDEKLVLHDDITNSPIRHLDYLYRVGDHYLFVDLAAQKYRILDAELKQVGYFEDYLYVQFLLGNKMLVASALGQIALFNEKGEAIMPFVSATATGAADNAVAVVDAMGTHGVLSLEKNSITWFDSADVMPLTEDLFVVKHNIAPEGEAEELNYFVYYKGALVGDYDLDGVTAIAMALMYGDYGTVGNQSDSAFDFICTSLTKVAEDTSVSVTYTNYLAYKA